MPYPVSPARVPIAPIPLHPFRRNRAASARARPHPGRPILHPGRLALARREPLPLPLPPPPARIPLPHLLAPHPPRAVRPPGVRISARAAICLRDPLRGLGRVVLARRRPAPGETRLALRAILLRHDAAPYLAPAERRDGPQEPRGALAMLFGPHRRILYLLFILRAVLSASPRAAHAARAILGSARRGAIRHAAWRDAP